MSLDEEIASIRAAARQELEEATANREAVDAACDRFAELADEGGFPPDFKEDKFGKATGWLIQATKSGLGGSGPIVVYINGSWDNVGWTNQAWTVLPGQARVPDADDLEHALALILTSKDA